MGGALVDRWQARYPGRRVTVVDEAQGALSLAQSKGYSTCHAVRDLPSDALFDLCLLSVKPQQFSALRENLGTIEERCPVLISILTGISIEALRASTSRTMAVVRAMPNLPARIGKGATTCFAAPSDERGRRAGDAFFANHGSVFWLAEEADFDPVTAVSGCGPAYVFLLMECLEAVARKLGVDASICRDLALQTVVGAAALAEASEQHPRDLRAGVTSKAGTTAAALQILMNPETGLEPLLETALRAAARRSVELGKISAAGAGVG